MPQAAQSVDYHAIASKNNSLGSIYEGANIAVPPEVQRIQDALGVQFKQGKPLPDGAIASVGLYEPKTIEINNPSKFAQGRSQTVAHEVTHLLQNSLVPSIQQAIPPDNPTHPYDISQADQWRAQGKKLWQIPHEAAAKIVQLYTADPSQRARLGPWIQDINSAPLSLMMPTSPDAKTLNRQVRPPLPPIESFEPTNIKQLVEQAKARKPKQ